jgi:hypothetical protein
MSKTSKEIDYIIKVGLYPVMKREGFLKSSHTFRRSREGYVQIINVQGSSTNYGNEGSFTINLAVYFPEAAKIYGVFQVTKRPLELDCMVRERIGHVMPAQQDFWWNFDSTSNLDQLAQKVVSACMSYGFPWLEEHSTIEGAINFSLSRKEFFHAAIFSLLHENREYAKQYLSEAIMESSHNPYFQSRLEDWGRSNGLFA